MDAAIDCLDRCMIFTEDQESDAEAKKRDSASAAELEKLTLEKDTVLRQLKTNITVEENFANGLVEKIPIEEQSHNENHTKISLSLCSSMGTITEIPCIGLSTNLCTFSFGNLY